MSQFYFEYVLVFYFHVLIEDGIATVIYVVLHA